MDKDYVKQYRKENKQRRRKQTLYGLRFFSLPHVYKLKIKAYRTMFGMGEKIFIGDNVFIYRAHMVGSEWGTISFGNDVKLGSNVIIDYVGKVSIGSHVDISGGAKIYSHDHDPYLMVHNASAPAIPRETVISDNVWIGVNAVILAGVTIGEFSVVGAGAIVTKDVPPNSIVAGNPAKVIKANENKSLSASERNPM